MRNKAKLTKQLVAQLPDTHKVSVDNAMTTWWYNIRPTGGMRLTNTGLKAFKEQLNIQHYEYRIPDPMLFTKKIILQLDRQLQEPYYILTFKNYPAALIFFGSKEAMLVNLYGDITKFLNNY